MMILLVDDDAVLLKIIESMIESEGYECITFSDGNKVIKYLQTAPSPDLIISDIVMPKMDGFTLRKEVSRLKFHSRVPFMFLSSLSDDENIVKGLDLGADDFMIKPVHAAIFKAKVRAVLRKSIPDPTPLFKGYMEKLPFPKLFQYCESIGLSGTVDIKSEGLDYTLQFKGGELDYNVLEDTDDVLEKLYGLTEGVFCISQYIANFDEIRASQVLTKIEPENVLIEKPMGMLSGVDVNEKLVQVQTEYVSTPKPAVVTIVVFKGRTIHKQVEDSISQLSKEEVEAIIKSQHKSVEEHIREKLSTTVTKNEESSETNFTGLFDQGLDEYMVGNYEVAYDFWSRAMEIDPNNKLLNINMVVLKKKMKKESP
jgi:DNA-binding response OmpR family regulator